MPEVLAKVYRSNLVESIHYGDLAIVDKYGNNVTSIGNSDYITYWRSAAKPFQALPVIFSGAAEKYGLEKEELAIMGASHNGEKEHVEVVEGILNKIGLDKSALLCGIHSPYHKPTAKLLYRSGEDPSELHNNCSGKHAGLLTLCQYYGWSIEDYLKPEHPVQQLILDVISEITDYPREKIYLGIDGCGVVVFGLPIKNMSYAYARLANPETLPEKYQEAAKIITKSMEDHPFFVAGSDRFNTKLMEVSKNKLVAKMGAEGVFCIGVHGDVGITLKISDGNSRAVPPVIVEILSQLGILNEKEIEQLQKYHKPDVLNNHKDKVGYIEPVFNIK